MRRDRHTHENSRKKNKESTSISNNEDIYECTKYTKYVVMKEKLIISGNWELKERL